eukprot:778500-Amphidinium_carterae.1
MVPISHKPNSGIHSTRTPLHATKLRNSGKQSISTISICLGGIRVAKMGTPIDVTLTVMGEDITLGPIGARDSGLERTLLMGSQRKSILQQETSRAQPSVQHNSVFSHKCSP